MATNEGRPAERPPERPAPDVQEDNPDVRHEHTDVDVRAVLVFAAALVVVAAVVHLTLYALFAFLNRREAARDVPPTSIERLQRREPPTPRLQEKPALDLQRFNALQDSTLESYGWVDQANGVVRIPIARAMELVVQRRLATRPGAQPVRNRSDFSDSSSGRVISTRDDQDGGRPLGAAATKPRTP